ncbi:MAG: cupin domain-containing protein [Solirubrobacteraceae bacterium]|jgi:quercetin dioxygenase-like cupin family protein
MESPINVDELETADLRSTSSDDAAWVGGYFAYGGNGANSSTVIYFAVPPGKRLGRHTDTAEETQFFLGGSGELLLDAGSKPVKAGDVIVLTQGTAHDLHNTGSEDLRVIGFFSAPEVEQHWTEEVWPGDLRVTSSPNAASAAND